MIYGCETTLSDTHIRHMLLKCITQYNIKDIKFHHIITLQNQIVYCYERPSSEIEKCNRDESEANFQNKIKQIEDTLLLCYVNDSSNTCHVK